MSFSSEEVDYKFSLVAAAYESAQFVLSPILFPLLRFDRRWSGQPCLRSRLTRPACESDRPFSCQTGYFSPMLSPRPRLQGDIGFYTS